MVVLALALTPAEVAAKAEALIAEAAKAARAKLIIETFMSCS
jgi:hypothetical protein